MIQRKIRYASSIRARDVMDRVKKEEDKAYLINMMGTKSSMTRNSKDKQFSISKQKTEISQNGTCGSTQFFGLIMIILPMEEV